MLLGPTIASCCPRSLMALQNMHTGIAPERFARFAPGQDGDIPANHPAFVYGHLGLYGPRIIEMAGGDASEHAVPADWAGRFAKGVTCQDDPDGGLYPSMETLIAHTVPVYEKAVEAVAQAHDDVLAAPTPDENIRVHFPTRGAMCNFLLTSHVMYHMGQLSTWRRAAGLPGLGI